MEGMHLVVGTYEELILGYHLDLDQEPAFSQYFTDHSHVGSVRTAAISQKGILATGSTDEVIRLLNLTRGKELGTLMQHQGSITDLCFFDNYMFSTSEDGTAIVWKTKKWEPQRTLRGHKAAVHSISVHPSGKMALTVSKDKTMKTWNLMTGKCAYTTNLKNVADRVLWSGDGEKYAVLYRTHVDIYAVQSGKIASVVRPGYTLNSAAFLEDQILALGGEGGLMYIYDLSQGTDNPLLKIDTSTNRVKCLRVDSCSTCESGKIVATASSDGQIQIWKITKHKQAWKSEKLCSYDCKFRPISLAFGRKRAKVAEDSNIKEEVGEEEEEEEEQEEKEEQEEEEEATVNADSSDDDDEEEEDEESEDEEPVEVKPKKTVKRRAPKDNAEESRAAKKSKPTKKAKTKVMKKAMKSPKKSPKGTKKKKAKKLI